MLTPLHSFYCAAGFLLIFSGDVPLGVFTLMSLAIGVAVDCWWRRPPFRVVAVLTAPVGVHARLAVESIVDELTARHALTYEQLGYLLEQMGRELRSLGGDER
jgi:hypothetical protein